MYLKTKKPHPSFVRVKESRVFFHRGCLEAKNKSSSSETFKTVSFAWLLVRRLVSSRRDITAASIGEENSDLALFLFGTSADENRRRRRRRRRRKFGPRRVSFCRTKRKSHYLWNLRFCFHSFLTAASSFHNNIFLHF